MLTEQEIIQMELDEIEAERRAELLDKMDILDIQYKEIDSKISELKETGSYKHTIEALYGKLKSISDKIALLNDEM